MSSIKNTAVKQVDMFQIEKKYSFFLVTEQWKIAALSDTKKAFRLKNPKAYIAVKISKK